MRKFATVRTEAKFKLLNKGKVTDSSNGVHNLLSTVFKLRTAAIILFSTLPIVAPEPTGTTIYDMTSNPPTTQYVR